MGKRSWSPWGMRVVAALLLLTAGCNWPGQPNPRDAPLRPDQVSDFTVLYAQRCSGCHGADGKLGPAPPLNDALFLAIIPDAELRRVIRAGRTGTPMPAFAKEHGGPLTDKQIDILADGMKTRWGKRDPAAQHAPSYLAPAASDKQHASAGRGAKVFARACAVCHGKDGRGADAGPINAPAFLTLISDQALRRYVITGRPDFGMPNYAEPRKNDPTFRPLTARGGRPGRAAIVVGAGAPRRSRPRTHAAREPMTPHRADQSDVPFPPPPGRRTFLHRVWLWTTVGTGIAATTALAIPFIRYVLGVLRTPRNEWVPLGALGDFPEGETAPGHVHQPDPPTVGRRGGADGSVRPLRGARRGTSAAVPGARGQLRPSGMSGDVVRAVGAVHVPVPRRRLLCKRRACVRTAAARPVSLRLGGARRGAVGASAPLSDVAGYAARFGVG